ncbi:MAG: thiamine-phosphate kinase [Deltaproteobacteria bacterium]|nr:thiamine-phosphate kinase [Deltaproteobacteria bacterium]
MGLKSLGEEGIIALFADRGDRIPPGLVKGIGDDCAVIVPDPQSKVLLTTDVMIEGVHFKPETTPPHVLGRKLLAVNVSDLAAMGARPRFALLTLGLPPDTDPEFVSQLALGLKEACREYDVTLVGGDTVRSPHGVVASLVMWGESTAARLPYRSAAVKGDGIFVTGTLGDSGAGCELLNSARSQVPQQLHHKLVDAHLNIRPRLDLGQHLVQQGQINAMIDLSDGLARDLDRVARASRVGAEIWPERIPLSQELRELGRLWGRDPLDWALYGGEDYELLFTAPCPAGMDGNHDLSAHFGVSVYWVGTITADPGVLLVDQKGKRPLPDQGFSHFGE